MASCSSRYFVKLQLKQPRLQSPIGLYEGRQPIYNMVPSHGCQLEVSIPRASSVIGHGGWFVLGSDL